MLQNAEDLKKEVSEENRIEKEEKEAKRLREKEESTKRYKESCLANAVKLINEHLPKIIRECEKNGIRQVILPDRGKYSSLLISDYFFEPNHEHCDYIATELNKFGYKTEFFANDVGNFEYITTADGYDIVDLPGTHKEYRLKIVW